MGTALEVENMQAGCLTKGKESKPIRSSNDGN
jgi:hypothetical protein